MEKFNVPDGVYLDTTTDAFVMIKDGVPRAKYGICKEVDVSVSIGTINGIKPQFTVKIDENGMIQGNLAKPKKKKWGVWNHEVSVRDNLALIERGHGLVGFTVDGQPACMYFSVDGVFKVSTSFWGVTSVSVSGLTETLTGRVGEFNGF